MKNLIAIVVLVFTISFGAQAQDLGKNEKVVKIKTSAICGMCKKRIETDMGLTKGVKSANLNLDNKILTVVYNQKQTNTDKLKTSVSKIGYDADLVVADQAAHNRLPDCCQKTAAPHKD